MNFPVENRWSERGAPDFIEKVGSRPSIGRPLAALLQELLALGKKEGPHASVGCTASGGGGGGGGSSSAWMYTDLVPLQCLAQ